MELPESASWHPAVAAKRYEELAEEAAGLYDNAFTEYGRLKAEFLARPRADRPGQVRNALEYEWSQTGTAKACVSDLGTYSVRAQTFAAMATLKYQRALFDFTRAKARGPQFPA